MAGKWSNLVNLKTHFVIFYIFHVCIAHWTDIKLKQKNCWKNGKKGESKILCHINPPCPIRTDHRTTYSPTLTTGVWEACTKRRGASNMNIHYDVTGLLTVVWRSHSGQIVWSAWGGGGFWTHSTYRWSKTTVGQVDLTAKLCLSFCLELRTKVC